MVPRWYIVHILQYEFLIRKRFYISNAERIYIYILSNVIVASLFLKLTLSNLLLDRNTFCNMNREINHQTFLILQDVEITITATYSTNLLCSCSKRRRPGLLQAPRRGEEPVTARRSPARVAHDTRNVCILKQIHRISSFIFGVKSMCIESQL